MSMPNISNIQPTIDLDRNDAINLLLASTSMQELSLAHIVNAEAEKIQFALGTLETAGGEASSLEDIMEVSATSQKMLRDVVKNQMLISMKLEDTLELFLASEEIVDAEEKVEIAE